MQALTLRTEVQRRDRERIAEITTATDVFYPPEVAVAVELVDDRLTKGKASDYQFLFVDEGEVTLGYAIYGFNSMTKSSWDLYWIAVDPESHGSGRRPVAAHRGRVARARRRLYPSLGRNRRPRKLQTHARVLRLDGLHDRRRAEDFYAPGDSKIVFVKAL
jgi:hypothetical protein